VLIDPCLEVVDQEGASTVWDNNFPTDQDAYRNFIERLNRKELAPSLSNPRIIPIERHQPTLGAVALDGYLAALPSLIPL
jgi:hypothetical protein